MDSPVERQKYPFGDLGGPALGTAGKGETTTQLATGGFNKAISPTFIVDGVFGYTRMDQFVGIPNVDKNVGLDIWKIPGTNRRQYANDTRYGGAPNLTGFGFTDLGFIDTWTPVWRHERATPISPTSARSTVHMNCAGDIEGTPSGVEPHRQPETANPRGASCSAVAQPPSRGRPRGAATNLRRGLAGWLTLTQNQSSSMR